MQKSTRAFVQLLGGMVLIGLGLLVSFTAYPLIGGVQKSKVGHEHLRAEELFSNLQADTGILLDTQPATIAITGYPVEQPAAIEGITYRACWTGKEVLQLEVVLEDATLLTLRGTAAADRPGDEHNWQHPYYARMDRYIGWQQGIGTGMLLAGAVLLLYALCRLRG